MNKRIYQYMYIIIIYNYKQIRYIPQGELLYIEICDAQQQHLLN